jgi:mannose-6-phosphate isomerase-like protein (cupin superfamily)
VRLGRDAFPPWCELAHAEIVRLRAGETWRPERRGPRERVVVVSGRCEVATGDDVQRAASRSRYALDEPTSVLAVTRVWEPTTVVRLAGRWGDETGGFGVFTVAEASAPADRGDPVDYVKRTNLDSHYHDCDEYWIVVDGRGVAVSEGRRYAVGPGDCVITAQGQHHDFPEAAEPVLAVYFETTLRGQRRRGHLWEHTHGPAARPGPDVGRPAEGAGRG